MGVLDSALGWIERAAGGVVQGVRTLRGGTPQKRKGIGERVLTTGMYGGAAWGWPGSWSQDRLEQVMHFRHWTYIAIRSICNAVAGLEPFAGFAGLDRNIAFAGSNLDLDIFYFSRCAGGLGFSFDLFLFLALRVLELAVVHDFGHRWFRIR